MRRLSAIIAGLCAGGVLAGCGTPKIDPAKIESAMLQVLQTQDGLSVRSVRCPQTIDITKGAVTYCTATLASGHTVRMAATSTNGSGEFRVAPAEMIADQVQSVIARALGKRGITATVSCPQHVPIHVGHDFICQALETQGRAQKIVVTIRPGGAFTTSFAR